MIEKDSDTMEDVIEFNIVFKDLKFKEIKENRAYDVKKLIGDVGGYIGLLLGYALLGLPEFMYRVYGFLKQAVTKKYNSSVKELSGNDSKVQVQECNDSTVNERKDGGGGAI